MKIKNLFNEKYDEMHHREIVIVRQDLNSRSSASRTVRTNIQRNRYSSEN